RLLAGRVGGGAGRVRLVRAVWCPFVDPRSVKGVSGLIVAGQRPVPSGTGGVSCGSCRPTRLLAGAGWAGLCLCPVGRSAGPGWSCCQGTVAPARLGGGIAPVWSGQVSRVPSRSVVTWACTTAPWPEGVGSLAVVVSGPRE